VTGVECFAVVLVVALAFVALAAVLYLNG